MAKVIVDLSMSLDGFIAGANDSPEQGLGEGGMRLFEWYFDGDTPIRRYEQAAKRGAAVPPFNAVSTSWPARRAPDPPGAGPARPGCAAVRSPWHHPG